MDLDTRNRRNLGYILWMLSVALIPVGLNFAVGSGLQVFFLMLSGFCFLLSRLIVPRRRTS